MDQDQDWYQGTNRDSIGQITAQTWNAAPQNEPGLLTTTIFYAMDQLVLGLRKAIQEGSLPSNFNEQVVQTGVQLVNILAQIGVKGGHEPDNKIERTDNAKPNWAAESYAAKAPLRANQTIRTSNVNKQSTAKPDKEDGRSAVRGPLRRELHPNLGKTRVAMAKWNFNGNLVISTLAGQSAGPLEPFFEDLHEFYMTTAQTPQDTKLNQVWYKVIIDGVSTGTQWRLNSGIAPRPHNSAKLKEELILYNPALAGGVVNPICSY
ncbi:hypothetical protein F5890DRAFT_1478630 [Lentinula detonsa]|uniref:Uncharacterized protein n=1 Tax=Lentinula detonsa TaxID=2804962 RepID=A0AA38UM09_9AGAR|nr:hypothetical protein F5890DRAFT_1478630 [Lentinula detonsa]